MRIVCFLSSLLGSFSVIMRADLRTDGVKPDSEQLKPTEQSSKTEYCERGANPRQRIARIQLSDGQKSVEYFKIVGLVKPTYKT